MVTPSVILSAFAALGVLPDVVRCLDDAYSLPEKRSVVDTFAPAFARWAAKQGLEGYRKNSRDCDKWSGFAVVFAQAMHAASGLETGLAFGTFDFLREDSTPHRLCAFVYLEDGPPQVGFFEPQTQSVVTLTEMEICSCTCAEI